LEQPGPCALPGFGTFVGGSDIESTVAAVLWDLRDPPNERFDKIQGYGRAIISILDHELDTTFDPTLADFRHAWAARGLPNLDSICAALACATEAIP
jgi:hypothetical protein